MSNLLDRLTARLAFWHARSVARRFQRQLDNVRAAQHASMQRALAAVAGSDFARSYQLNRVDSADALRRAAPLRDYEGLRPYVDRVVAGETRALLAESAAPLMFATSSGTTARRKLIPVTPAFVRDYRRGWNVFGLKMLSDHPEAVLRYILQSSGRHDEDRSPAGVPIGAITGLLARTQKAIVKRFYVGRPEIAQLSDPQARYYALARLGIERDVAFLITANPATLVRIAQTADALAETLIRDVRDGAIAAGVVDHAGVRAALSRRLRPNPTRARALEQLLSLHGRLRPADYWRLSFVACWTGGSMGQHLPRVADWFGNLPVRDIGLLASEGRVTLPFEDGVPAGVLDVTAGLFEFIPLEQFDAPQPQTCWAWEVQPGQRYAVVLSNTAGLIRYRLDDIVLVRDMLGETPVLEFLHRGGRVASLTGEKLTENQVVAAVREAARGVGAELVDFLCAPRWADPPHYRVTLSVNTPPDFATRLDAALMRQNEEYAGRRRSLRLGPLTLRTVDPAAFVRLDEGELRRRGSTAEQYKRVCLYLNAGDDDAALQSPGAIDAPDRNPVERTS